MNNIQTPISQKDANKLKVGDKVYLTGEIITGRDQAHKRMYDTLKQGKALLFDIDGWTIYYTGPCPEKPGEIIGSCGPTTSVRMDKYSPLLIKRGLKFMIGKGERSKQVIEEIKNSGGIYFAAIGGLGAMIAKCVKKVDIIAYDDLGTEAIRKLYVENMPVIVAIDSKGNSIYNR